jgi:hypothetical protein
MILKLLRFHSGIDDSLGLFFIDGKFAAFTLEDEKREVKVMNETRIPAGQYQVKFTYSPKYGKFMLQIMDVPKFEGIRIHPGNTEADTSGCLIPGNVCRFNPKGNSRVEESTLAYERISTLIINALNKETVMLIIKDEV